MCDLARNANLPNPTLLLSGSEIGSEIVIGDDTYQRVDSRAGFIIHGYPIPKTIPKTPKKSRHGVKTAAETGKTSWRRKAWLLLPICWYCECDLLLKEITLDHIIPRSKGGRNHASNYAIACEKCNKTKADQLLDQCGMILKHKPC